jgi:antirestriction protein
LGSTSDFAYQLLEDTGALNDMPENLRNYFDYKAYGRDLELGGDVFTIALNSKLHVFWNH